jgi:NAD(P)-dependent dehydrogenase (short-subunit alcohol dehydrogenase family)
LKASAPGSALINMASAAGIAGSAGMSVYCATKFGIEGLSRALALELGDLVTVTYTPNGIGSPIVQSVAIDSITHDMRPGGPHIVELTLSRSLSAFIIGESLLGEGLIGF